MKEMHQDLKWLKENEFELIGSNIWQRKFSDFSIEVRLINNEWFEASIVSDKYYFEAESQMEYAWEAVKEAVHDNMMMEQNLHKQNEELSKVNFS